MTKLAPTFLLLIGLCTALGFSMTSCGAGGGEICDDDTDNDGDGDVDCDDPDCTAESTDADADGYRVCDIPELSDCDDSNPDVNPETDEACDDIDNDCDGVVDNVDLDGDGFLADTCGGNDCDDANGEVFPGNPEQCDFADNDCDGQIDNGFDADDDGWTFCAGDCRDSDPLINPDAEELCDDIDNNCDGNTDEAFDADGDGYIDANDPFCESLYGPGGSNEELGDCDDDNDLVRPGAMEDPSDAFDNDCDNCLNECEDQDEDGFDNCDTGDVGDATCTGDTDGDGQPNSGGDDGLAQDCVDASLDFDFLAQIINPGMIFTIPNMEGNPVQHPEQCDGRDNNCDGTIDEGFDLKTCNPLF
ncbi:MAG: hypothetical protein KDA24_06955 [Deltaproteobacteria bacterium]|nr:hypothetical protein [Deltaproteobacteria bacterium]